MRVGEDDREIDGPDDFIEQESEVSGRSAFARYILDGLCVEIDDLPFALQELVGEALGIQQDADDQCGGTDQEEDFKICPLCLRLAAGWKSS